MAVIEETFPVEPIAIGRVDYSSAVEVSTEPFVTSWQDSYHHYQGVDPIPAGGSLTISVPIEASRIVILYDFFATIPANRLIRLSVFSEDSLGATARIADKMDYQAITMHLSKGAHSVNHIWFVVYNYATTVESNMWIGCSGMFTLLAEFTYDIADLPVTP